MNLRAAVVAVAWLLWPLHAMAAPGGSFSRSEELTPQDQMLSRSLARITPIMKSMVDSGELPCVATVVLRRGRVIHEEYVGARNVETSAPLTTDTIFRIYSMTKPITAAAAMALVEDGVLRLDEPVAAYLPQFARMGVYDGATPEGFTTKTVARAMTVRDLLRHTSGLPYGYSDAHPVDALYKRAQILDRRGSLVEMLRKLETLPLRYQPGERWHYGLSSDVLGALIEHVTSETLESFCQRRIFVPLGMLDTGFEVPKDKQGRFAGIYTAAGKGKLRPWGGSIETTTYYPPVTFCSGGGGAVSTVADFVRFSEMLRRRGELDGVRILKPETVDMMTTNALPNGAEFRPGFGFGFGMQVCVDIARSKAPGRVGTYGWAGGGTTFFVVDPSEQMVVMAWSQFSGNSSIGPTFRKLVYDALDEAERLGGK